MSKLTTLRKPTAIAPGLTVRAYSRYKSYRTHEEVVAIEGDLAALNDSQARRLSRWLDRWRIAKTDAEFGANG